MTGQTATIPKGWKMTTLGEVLSIKNGKSRPHDGKTYPVYGGNGVLGYSDEYNINEKIIIVGRVGAYCGSIFLENEKFWLSDNALGVLPKENSNIDFLYYLLIKTNLNKQAIGGAQPLLTQGVINQIEVLAPEDKEEQRAIAMILSSLDGKIELLSEQNKTLEATAQTIFKEWFVNFNFPGATGKMIDSELGEIPEGWRVGRLEEIVNDKKNSIVDGPFGTQMKIEEYQKSGIPVIEMDYLGDTFITKQFRHFLSDEKFVEVKRSCAEAGDIIISKTGTLGLLGILPDYFDKGIIVSRIAKISPSIELRNKLFIYQFLKYLQSKQYWNRISSGSTMPIFNLTHIKEVQVVIPDGDLYSKFEFILSPVYKKILNNLLQLQTLSTLRDTLLPKLMKGEVRVEGFKD